MRPDSSLLFLFLGLAIPAVLTSPMATTEQLRQWILANRKSLPGGEETSPVTGGDTDLASTILRLFGFGGEKTTDSSSPLPATARIVKTTQPMTTPPAPATTTKPVEVCPFNSEPLILAGDYAYCKPSSVGDCPVGFLCDQSFVLGRTTWKSVYNKVTPTPDSMRRTESVTEEAIVTRVTSPPTTVPSTTPSTAATTAKVRFSALKVRKLPELIMNPWAALWTSTASPRASVNVSVLQAGHIRQLKDSQLEMVGAITLINDNGFNVLVDTGAASDTERLLASLSKEDVSLEQINTVVITHGHPGHMGNMNFFAQKPVLFHSMEYIGRHATPTELKDRPYRKISANIEVWKTPGHTQHDLTVLVHNVAGYGTMAIVGDLIPNESLISEKRDDMADEGVWDSAIKRQNANLIVCMADWIVPGHGQPFRVLAHYRQKAGCTRLLAQKNLLNN